MNNALLTAGKFAKLARTTKRTVLWYEQCGILLPAAVAENGYRAYEPRQILDFQIISLLRQLDFSLEEIKQHVNGGQSLMSLFGNKKSAIARQIRQLERMLRDMETYHCNLSNSDFLVRPEVRHVEPVDIYYLPVVAPYASIPELCRQLGAKFEQLSSKAVFLTVFENQDYNPQAAPMRIGVVKRPGLRLKAGVTEVEAMTIPGYDALVHTHQGDGSLLSLLWTELGKCRRAHHMPPAKHLDFYELEFYHPAKNASEAGAAVSFEMHLPVLTR